MEDRYEIQERIGQGGIGSVHRAFDHKMNRQVAIKRILTSGEDPNLEGEATKQMLAEVGALASLQHPHIVTVFDVGADEEGPYVVMELIHGKTLDEIIENAPLTWEDFRTVAMQSLEALIAAHDLGMIHSDLKPPNIMLSWMPSGAFQIKIVDFGLATLIHKQSQEEIEKMDNVYGSVYFMPPEQFERKTLDSHSDVYSLGCCFYQSLAGCYPFDGATVAEVMQAHLDHSVMPLSELRDDLPDWVCDWVMAMISREPAERQSSAREALSDFVQNDKKHNAAISQRSAVQEKPQLITSNAPIKPPTGPVLLVPGATSTQTAAVGATATHSAPEDVDQLPVEAHGNRGMKSGKVPMKKILRVGIPVAGALVLIMTVWLLMKRNESVRERNAYNSIIAMAEQHNVRQIHIDLSQLTILFDFITRAKSGENLSPAFGALAKATSKDGSDVDAAIIKFATRPELSSEIRSRLFSEVIAERNDVTMFPALIEFASNASRTQDALDALQVIDPKVLRNDAKDLLDIVATTSNTDVRLAAERLISDAIANGAQHPQLTDWIRGALEKAKSQEAKIILGHLQEQAQPKEIVRTNPQHNQQQNPPLNQPSPQPSPQQPKPSSNNPPTKYLNEFIALDESQRSAFITKLSQTFDTLAHLKLTNIAQAFDGKYRSQAIDALISLNSHPNFQALDSRRGRVRWLQIIWQSATDEEKIKIIDALAKFQADWATILVEELSRGVETPASIHAKKTLENLK